VSFSLELSEDVIQVRDWVHEFAATVVRPAAAEWDEREETPWPIIQEARRLACTPWSCSLRKRLNRRASAS